MDDETFHEMFPLSGDKTEYRILTSDHVSTAEFDRQKILVIEQEGIKMLTEKAFGDIAHYLRPAHLQQLANIPKDGEESDNDRFGALDLLKNEYIASAGILPMCQDTGTAIIMGKKGQNVWVRGNDEAAISNGVLKTYQELNLRYSNVSPLSMFQEINTGNNLPAQIDLYSTHGDKYKFLFIAKV
ncbi:MAG: Fumarate hydratase class I, aerobic [Alphaproteobacteria bacterium MarineAlpha11_Bin1]|nr:MAG: Fumarate hydratase class I, aerobic [Alphaproteobacteria bacterium MarineAlpha11_Bin1]|tara:strand:+ start:3212 stop:3766 length:555 start_codon:yes stop_codon:yes gene_type:complete